MVDGNLFAESSPAKEGTIEEAAQEPETQDAENQKTVDEAEKPSEESPDSESKAESDEDETETSSEDEERSEQKTKPHKGYERRIKQLTAKWRSEQEARQALEKRLNEPEQESVDLKEPEKPSIENFEKWDEYQKAETEYLEKRDKWVAEKAKQDKVKADNEAKRKATEERLQKEIQRQEIETLNRYPEYDRSEALQTVQPNQVMRWMLQTSKIGPDILWNLHEDPDEVDRIQGLDEGDQMRAMFEIEKKLLNRINGKKAPKKKPPPEYVDDKGAVPDKQEYVWDKLYK